MTNENKGVSLYTLIRKPWAVKIFNQIRKIIWCWQSGGLKKWKEVKRIDPGKRKGSVWTPKTEMTSVRVGNMNRFSDWY